MLKNQKLVNQEVLADFIVNELACDELLYNKLFGIISNMLRELSSKELNDNITDSTKWVLDFTHKAIGNCKLFGADSLIDKLSDLEEIAKSGDVKKLKNAQRDASWLVEPTLKEIDTMAKDILIKVAKSA